MYINLIFQTISFYILLKQCCSFTFLFMYLGELQQYYQSSNNLPQSAQTLDLDLKSCFVLLNTSSCSARCRLVSVSIFADLFCTTPRVALLVVDLFLYKSLLLWFAQHLRSLCSLLTCLDCLNLSCFVLDTLTRSCFVLFNTSS